MKRQSKLVSILFVITFVASIFAGHAHAAQSHMLAARNHLRAARHQLEMALADKGGHRERAISIIDNALGEVNAGMEFSREH
jgi:hypothetical protein